jgi:hypothetical protein
MEGIGRTLTQERAILVARQGDPKSPAPGTLLARQKILHAELEAAHSQSAESPRDHYGPATLAPARHPDLIRRDIRRIEDELIRVQRRLREIERQMANGGDRAISG